MNDKPLHKLRFKGISVTIWPARNGGYQCSVQKQYKDKESDSWKSTSSYFPEELDELRKLLKEAGEWMHENSKETISGNPVEPADEDDTIW